MRVFFLKVLLVVLWLHTVSSSYRSIISNGWNKYSVTKHDAKNLSQTITTGHISRKVTDMIVKLQEPLEAEELYYRYITNQRDSLFSEFRHKVDAAGNRLSFALRCKNETIDRFAEVLQEALPEANSLGWDWKVSF